MFRKLIGACVGLAMMGMAGAADAGSITIGGGQIAAPDIFENFDIGVSIAGVSTEFASSGLNFTTLSGAGISLILSSNCINGGFSGE